jgi:hypothetical protein
VSAMANANPVAGSKASTVAGNFYKQTYNADAGTLTLVYTETSSDGQAVYYVYNVGTNKGFVIVSAEDAGYPIIGSSNTGHYVIPTTNNNVGFWMNKRKNEIISMRARNVQATSDISDEWNAYFNNTARNTHQSMSVVAPLLGNTKWDQEPDYNEYCPHGSVTGCVATAMAQIMRYWNYPSVGLGSWCYYDEVSYGFTENYGQLCVTLDTSNYVWSAMPDSLTSYNHQVAKLMYDCGVSVDMDYSPSGSGAFVTGPAPSAQNSYVEFFNYYRWSINGIMQSSYSTAAWLSIMDKELSAGRPVQYEGTDPTNGGHSWVCDGNNGSNQLHMNWGWSGQDDGYYSATSLTPTGYDFDQHVGAIIGIMPAYKGLGIDKISTNSTFKIYPNPSNGIFNVSLENVSGNPQINIYNVLGQQVYTSKLTTVETSLNLSNQAKGVYIYRVLNENGDSISTGRLVIQ